ncbi:lasso peptide biosynthesis B2 protein [Phenylobacterium sp. J426]|uniref:lasso peptide biosynthesis B2 protein n=1 Tax=Phenylobacterium sp. J426 TaxID=2898439 RepID=UPI0035B32B30
MAPLPAKCLVRSFALLCFLRRCGHDAAWCFGVSTWPFAAHCWLQVGEVALDDHPDQLAAYTPIHVV